MSAALERGQLLLAQGRYVQAETELREALAHDPQEPVAQALLAIALMNLDKLAPAREAAESAIALAPDWAYTHYVHGMVLLRRDQLAKAEEAAGVAISMDPHHADYFALTASIRYSRRAWARALEAAEEALRIDPEHEHAMNMRAQILLKLGRREEARDTMAMGLSQHPDAAHTHANQGWVLLESGDPAGALGHFEEALRLDPTLEWAREGVITALKARYRIYRVVLAFFSWMSRLTPAQQWGVLIAGYFGFRALRTTAQNAPEWQPLLVPLGVLYAAFVLLTWVVDPLFNLVLRFNRYGRMVLSERELKGTTVFGGALALALGLTALFVGLGPFVDAHARGTLMAAAIVSAAMLMPIAATLNVSHPESRARLGNYTAVLGVVGAGYLLAQALGLKIGGLLLLIGVVAFLGFQVYANSLAIRRQV